jgi:hypothetical protein
MSCQIAKHAKRVSKLRAQIVLPKRAIPRRKTAQLLAASLVVGPIKQLFD